MTSEFSRYIGFAIDGKVEQMFIVDDRIAAIFLSEPEIVDLTNNPEIEKHNTGHIWSTEMNKWLPSRPYMSWTINEDGTKWIPPVPMPDDGFWSWNEQDGVWVEANENIIPLE